MNITLTKNIIQRFFCFISIYIVFFVILPIISYAELTLNVSPIDGSGSLRFNQQDKTGVLNKKIRIRINSTGGVQYQLFQRILEPIQNERGQSLNSDVIQYYSETGSNAAGTLYTQNLTSLRSVDDLIYLSSQDGSSDSLTLYYQIDETKLHESGRYIGKLNFSLRSTQSSQHDVILDVYVESSGALKIETKTTKGQTISLNAGKVETLEDSLKISLTGTKSSSSSLSQEFLQEPQNENNITLNRAVLNFKVWSESGNTAFPDFSPIKNLSSLLYKSKTSADDTILITYNLDKSKLASVESGIYKGRIRYTINSGTEEKTLDNDIEIIFPKVFLIDLKYPNGPIQFEHVIPKGQKQYKEILVTVKSNIHKPYSVTQNMLTLLTNVKGDVIKKDFFKIKEEVVIGGPGKVSHADFVSIGEGDTVVYTSDNAGSPVQFKITFELSPDDPNLQPGNFGTNCIYSLGEI